LRNLASAESKIAFGVSAWSFSREVGVSSDDPDRRYETPTSREKLHAETPNAILALGASQVAQEERGGNMKFKGQSAVVVGGVADSDEVSWKAYCERNDVTAVAPQRTGPGRTDARDLGQIIVADATTNRRVNESCPKPNRICSC